MFKKLKEDNIKKLNEFEKELGYIKDPRIKNVVEIAICYIHPLFFEVAASSSGKYHPAYGLGKRGLLRHTRAAVYFANILNEINTVCLSDVQKDIAIGAIILHDSCKRGVHFEDDKTKHEHPLLVSQLVPMNTFYDDDLKIWNDICDAISTHMGQWVTSQYSTITLPSPKTTIQKFVHECDYLASRRQVDVLEIWSKEDLDIIEESRKFVAEEDAKKEAAQDKITEAQENYLKTLVAEYKDSCSKLGIEVPKKYLSDNFSYLSKKAAGGFIGAIKKSIESNKDLLAKRC